MNREEFNNLKEGDLVRDKNGTETELVYTGWNNGHIFEFYGYPLDDVDDTEELSSRVLMPCGPSVVRLTRMELLYGYTKC